eukprot:15431403-Alexandrium_andersonii.AAC.1
MPAKSGPGAGWRAAGRIVEVLRARPMPGCYVRARHPRLSRLPACCARPSVPSPTHSFPFGQGREQM